jgi:aryl-phospho-beta-D-glucosidase BglC (GH1 family)
MNAKWFKLFLTGLSISGSVVSGQVTPWEMVARMGKGINLGNTLEAPNEGDWSSPAEGYYFHDFIEAGFTCVRIPIRWTNHMLDSTPYTVDSAWMDRVEEVIDWALDTGLVVIINSHHDDEWLYDEFPKNIGRFEILWEQIATKFKDKSENLVFEIVNEPYFDLSRAEVDTLHQRIFPIIRQSNPTRIVIFTGGGNDTEPRMTNYRVFYNLNVPDDPYIMAYFHYYVPYEYCQLGQGTWGTSLERAQMIHDFTVAKDWSDTRNVPILLGEFGVIRKAHRPSMVKWYELLSETADAFGFARTTWCNGERDSYATYYRNPEYWDHELLNIQTRQFPYSGSIITAPCIIEAEDFDLGGQQIAYNSMDSINTLGFYRPDEGVEIDSVGDSSYAVLISQQGEWQEYSFSVDTASLYEVVLDVSTLEEGKTIQARFNGSIHTASLRVPQGSSKDEFSSLRDTVYMEAGVQVVRVFGENSGVYVDKIALNKLTTLEDTINLLTNADFELGIVGWGGHSAAIEIVEDPVQSGSAAMLVKERQANWASVQQNITEILREHGPGYYTSSAYMKAPADTGFTGKVTIQITVGGETSYLGAGDSIPPGAWKKISNNLLINWEGNLQEALFYIETVSPYTGDFYCDNASLTIDSLLAPPTSIILNEANPESFGLSQNYPNPFHRHTSIQFTITKPGLYQLVVFDIHGQAIKRIVDEKLQIGTYDVKFNAETLLPGIYFYRLTGSGVNLTRKMMLMK